MGKWSGFDNYGNHVDGEGYIYDRENGSWRGNVGGGKGGGGGFLRKLILIVVLIYFFPDFLNNLNQRHPEIHTVLWVVIILWLLAKIRKIFRIKRG